MADLAAFYEARANKTELAPKPERQPSKEVADLLQKGNCVQCHGENFSKPVDPSFPKLAGQYADYLFVALKSYQTQKNANIGRGNPVMAGMAASFTHDQLKQLAQYIGSLPGQLQVAPQGRFK
jgi:cytochrome c553